MKKYKNIQFEDIDPNDYPDYVDSYVSYAEHEDGTPLTDEELDKLTDSDDKYELLMEYLQ